VRRDEFVRLRGAIDREAPRFDWLVAIALTVAAVSTALLARSMSEPLLWGCIALLFGTSVAYMAYSVRWAKQTGLLCHACRRPMLKRAAELALATGTCPHCRKDAFDVER
jgi:hypothetical protein